jgi:hypothetical protein
VQQRAGGDHLGVQASVRRALAQEIAAVPVSPVHHRSDAETMSVVFAGIFQKFSHLCLSKDWSISRYFPRFSSVSHRFGVPKVH